MRLRLLLPQPMLHEIADAVTKGATFQSQLRRFELKMAGHTLAKLVRWYQTPSLHPALFPAWLTPTAALQIQPLSYDFKGRFPLGEWVERNNSTSTVAK